MREGYSPIAQRKANPMIMAGRVVCIVAHIEATLCLTNRGNNASPSCEIALATKAGNEITPSTYADMAII